MARLASLCAVLVALSLAPTAHAGDGPQVYLVHVDAHMDLVQGGAEQASEVVLALAKRLQALSMLEYRVFGVIERTRWQILVSAGQGERSTLVARLEQELPLPSPSQLAGWIGARIDGRPGTQISLWPLQQLVGELGPAPAHREHQLLRLVASAQEADSAKNAMRVVLLRKRMQTWVAAADLDLVPLRLEAEGWKPLARSDTPRELTSVLVSQLEQALEAAPKRWGSCDRVLVGSSLVDVLYVGGAGAAPPAEVLRLAGTATLPAEWDIDVGRLKLLRLDAIPELTGIHASVATQARIVCRYDSRVQPAWHIVRDGNLFDGVRVFRSERLIVQAKASAELNPAGLAVSIARDGEAGDRLCPLEQALGKGCVWQPVRLGEHTLTLVEPSGERWELLTSQRTIDVIQPLAVDAALTLTPSTCADSAEPIPFESQSFAWSVPESLCVDYRVALQAAAFELTPEQRLAVLSAMRIQLTKGEHVVREMRIDATSGVGQTLFLLGEEHGEPVVGAGPVTVRLVSSRSPAVFRDANADVTYELAFSGVGAGELELSDLRPLAYGSLVFVILALAALALWVLLRAHHLQLRFDVRGWPEHTAASVRVRATAPSVTESSDGLKPITGIHRIGARRVRGGYELTFVSPVVESPKPVRLQTRQRGFEWGPFDVTVTRLRGANE